MIPSMSDWRKEIMAEVITAPLEGAVGGAPLRAAGWGFSAPGPRRFAPSVHAQARVGQLPLKGGAKGLTLLQQLAHAAAALLHTRLLLRSQIRPLDHLVLGELAGCAAEGHFPE